MVSVSWKAPTPLITIRQLFLNIHPPIYKCNNARLELYPSLDPNEWRTKISLLGLNPRLFSLTYKPKTLRLVTNFDINESDNKLNTFLFLYLNKKKKKKKNKNVRSRVKLAPNIMHDLIEIVSFLKQNSYQTSSPNK